MTSKAEQVQCEKAGGCEKPRCRRHHTPHDAADFFEGEEDLCSPGWCDYVKADVVCVAVPEEEAQRGS